MKIDIIELAKMAGFGEDTKSPFGRFFGSGLDLDRLAALHRQALIDSGELVPREQVEADNWSVVYTAVTTAVAACKKASGMHKSIDMYVNAAQITHDVLGTDLTEDNPAAIDRARSQP